MSLEARSGPKILLKLLLDKTNDVLTQSVDNKTEITRLREDVNNLSNLTTKMIFHLELITGEKLHVKDTQHNL